MENTNVVNKRVGYIRVSTEEQNTDRQYKELEHYKLDKIIQDKATGKNINENLITLLGELVEGDELIVLSLDRLGRSLKNNIEIIERLKQNGIKFRSIKENLYIDSENNDPMNEFTYTIFSAVAQLERAMLKERQQQGINARKEKLGKAYNQQAKDRTKMLRNLAFRQDIKIKKREYVMDKWGISRTTYFRYKKLIVVKEN